MSFLKKVLRAAKKPLLGALRTGLGMATGGISDRVLNVGGEIATAYKAKKAAKLLEKAPKLQVYTTQTSMPTQPKAIAMPGGAALSKLNAPSIAGKKRRKSAPKAKGTRKGRSVPSGGLDLKAMAVAWRAAGKPGSWRNWIKTQPIRKP